MVEKSILEHGKILRNAQSEQKSRGAVYEMLGNRVAEVWRIIKERYHSRYVSGDHHWHSARNSASVPPS
jgi:hypothetical protein